MDLLAREGLTGAGVRPHTNRTKLLNVITCGAGFFGAFGRPCKAVEDCMQIGARHARAGIFFGFIPAASMQPAVLTRQLNAPHLGVRATAVAGLATHRCAGHCTVRPLRVLCDGMVRDAMMLLLVMPISFLAVPLLRKIGTKYLLFGGSLSYIVFLAAFIGPTPTTVLAAGAFNGGYACDTLVGE